jgi:predicted nucleic acid-binding protein
MALLDALALFNTSKLDIVDCLVIAKARRENGEPFSFDRELSKEFDSSEIGKKELP